MTDPIKKCRDCDKDSIKDPLDFQMYYDENGVVLCFSCSEKYGNCSQCKGLFKETQLKDDNGIGHYHYCSDCYAKIQQERQGFEDKERERRKEKKEQGRKGMEKECGACKSKISAKVSEYGEKGSVFTVPIGSKNEREHGEGKRLTLCFDCWNQKKESYKKMVDEGEIGGEYHITNSGYSWIDDSEYDPNSSAWDNTWWSNVVVKCVVCSKWSTEPEVKKTFHFDPVGSVDKDNTCSTKCGTIVKEKEELEDLESNEKAGNEHSYFSLSDKEKQRLIELRKKYNKKNDFSPPPPPPPPPATATIITYSPKYPTIFPSKQYPFHHQPKQQSSHNF